MLIFAMCLRALTLAAALPGGRLNKDCCRRGSPRAIYRSRGFRNPFAAAREKHFKVFPKTTFVPTSPLISLSGPQNAVDGQLCVRGVVAYVSDLKHRPNLPVFTSHWWCSSGMRDVGRRRMQEHAMPCGAVAVIYIFVISDEAKQSRKAWPTVHAFH